MRSVQSKAPKKATAVAKSSARKNQPRKAAIVSNTRVIDDVDVGTESEHRESSDQDSDSSGDFQTKSLHSDALDEDEDLDASYVKSRSKAKAKAPRNTPSTRKSKRKRTATDDEAQEENSDSQTGIDTGPVPASSSKRKQATKMKPTWKEKKGDGKTKGGSAKTRQNSDSATPARKRKRTKLADDQDKIDSGSDSDDAEVEVDLKEGQEVVGVVVKAPKTGWAPPGQVSKNTLDFLARLKDPACNDREWFKLNEPVYRRAETEFKAFIDAFSTMLSATDPQIPPLPPKDVIHRIYRDIRFSNDKTPYKTGFSASFSRSGRKGRFAFYHIMIKPGGESIFAAGAWCPGKDELALIRSHIQHTSLRDRLRSILAAPAFISRFGERAIFGREDELKVAPKGVGKDHRDIDLLKCRTLAVSCRLTDAQVLSSGFVDELRDFVEDVRPFVHCLNDMMTLPMEGFMNEDSDGGDGEGGDESED